MLSNQIMDEIRLSICFHLYFWSSPGHYGETVSSSENQRYEQLFIIICFIIVKTEALKKIIGQEENEYNSDYWIVRMRQANTILLCLDY